MRPYWLVLLVACSTAEKERADYVEQAREETDWSKKLELLEMAVKTDGINLDSRLLLAETYLVAFNEPEKARDIYLRIRKRSRPRGFHGLGRCALFEGQEEVGRDYLRQSLEARPSVRCAIDLAARVGDPERARILAMPLGGRRWEFFRAAQGAASLPEKIPDDPSYALARARMAKGEEQGHILSAHLADSCANDGAKQAYARFLLGQSLFARNFWLQNVVKEGD